MIFLHQLLNPGTVFMHSKACNSGILRINLFPLLFVKSQAFYNYN